MEHKTPKILLEAINTAQLEDISLEDFKKFIDAVWDIVEQHRLEITKRALKMITKGIKNE